MQTSIAKIAWARNEDGELVHVSSVPRGAACNCKCPKYDELLLARKGVERTHHFAHKPDVTCVCALETVLHLLAKKIISDESAIRH